MPCVCENASVWLRDRENGSVRIWFMVKYR